MIDASPSVWQQDKKGDWLLYFNTDMKLIPPSISNIDSSKNKKNFSSEKNFVLGTLVMSPKGIGRIIKKNDNKCIIRFKQNNIEEQFLINEISNNISFLISEYSSENINLTRLKIKVTGKVDDIFEELNKIQKIKKDECNYSLIFNGDVLKKDTTFEQLNILNNCKLLLMSEHNIKYTLSRFIIVNQFWYSYSTDGICFSPSHKIKLIGVGLYGSHENKTIHGAIKILDGSSINDKILYEDNIEIGPAENKANAVIPINFSKPVLCKQNQDYSIVLISRVSTNSYYGQQGKSTIEGEKGVIFSFKKIQGRNSGTSVESGNFPELYYYLQYN